MKLNIFVALALSTSVLTLAAPVPTGVESLTRAFVSVRKALTKVGSGSSRKVEGSMYNEGINHDTNIPGHSSIPPPSHSNPKSSADSTPDHSPPASPPPRQPSTTHAYPDSAHRGGQRHAPVDASGNMYPDPSQFTTHRAPVAEHGSMYPDPSQLDGSRHVPAAAPGTLYPGLTPMHRAPAAEHVGMYPDPREHGGPLYAPAAASSGHFVGMEHMLPTGVKPHPESSYGGMQFGGSTQHYPTQHATAAYPHDNYAGYPNTYAGSQGSYSGSHGNYAGYHELWSPWTYRPGHSVPGQSYSEMGTNRHYMDGAPGQIVSPPRESYPWSH